MKRLLSLLIRQVQARVRLVSAMLFGVALYGVFPAYGAAQPTARFLVCWNAAVVLYVVMALWVMVHADVERMRQHADRQDEGQKTILLLTMGAVLASLVAIVAELSSIKALSGIDKIWHIALTVITVASSWVFMHLMFAMHYAHDYYRSGRRGHEPGLAFPNEAAPDYWDFLYFSAVIGTSGQTADVAFTSKAMRRTGLVHCILAYVYNTTVLALTINIAASLM